MSSTAAVFAPVELSPAEVEAVSGGAIPFFAGVAIGAAVVLTAAIAWDNHKNGGLADGWYRLTH